MYLNWISLHTLDRLSNSAKNFDRTQGRCIEFSIKFTRTLQSDTRTKGHQFSHPPEMKISTAVFTSTKPADNLLSQIAGPEKIARITHSLANRTPLQAAFEYENAP
ncbi:hypothetical protein V6N13_082565 [Hibiscus sabdariffa]